MVKNNPDQNDPNVLLWNLSTFDPTIKNLSAPPEAKKKLIETWSHLRTQIVEISNLNLNENDNEQ